MVPACILQSHSAVLPPDSSIIYRNKVLLFCRDYQLNAERITSWKNEDTIITLNVSGKDVSGFSKFILETSEGEKYIIRLSNGTTVYVNSVSSIEFNPQAPNFFDIKKGEAYFEVKQNSKIYISAKIFVWALAGAAMNVAYYGPYEHAQLSFLKGQAKAIMEKKEQRLDIGKMYSYISDDLKGSFFDTNDVNAWINESFDYKGITYSYLVERIAVWYRKKVVYKGKNPLFHVSFHGHYSEPLAVILSRLNAKKKKFQCYVEGDKLIVQ
jgi:hypothetical protein